MMTVINMKVTRQKLMQTAILDKIDRDHLSLNTDSVRRSLQTVRDHVSRSPYFTELLDRWEPITYAQDKDLALDHARSWVEHLNSASTGQSVGADDRDQSGPQAGRSVTPTGQ